jgi:hypothetical protein
MSRSSRLLPLPPSHPSSWWIAPLLLVSGCAMLPVILFIPKFDDELMALLWIGFTLLGSVAAFVLHLHQRAQPERWIRRAAALGLTEVHERVGRADLDPFLGLPLFRFGDAPHDCARAIAIGTVEGVPLCVVEYSYGGWYSSRDGKTYFGGGTQTLALFRDCALPDFHLAPEENDWNVMRPGWDQALELGPAIRAVNPFSFNPFSFNRSWLRGHDADALDRLFGPERVRNLGDLTGWTIECREGRAAVYRHGEVITVDDLAAFVLRAVDFLAVLTAAQEGGERRAGGERHVQQGQRRGWMAPRRGGPGSDEGITDLGDPPLSQRAQQS